MFLLLELVNTLINSFLKVEIPSSIIKSASNSWAVKPLEILIDLN